MSTRYIFSLSVVAILSMSGSVFAGFGGGSGTPDDPYLIYTKEHLLDPVMLSGQMESLYVKLMSDIDLEGQQCQQLFKQHGFRGVFDGNGKSIINVYMVNQSGLIKSIHADSTIKNLTLVDPNLIIDKQNLNVGLLVVQVAKGATVSNCHVKGGYIEGPLDLDQKNRGVSAAGLVYSNNGTIENSSFSGFVMADRTGGLVVVNRQDGTIEDSFASVNLRAGRFAGGLADSNYGSIRGCATNGIVKAERASATSKNHVEAAGGLVGRNYGYFLYYDASGYEERKGLIVDCNSICNVSTNGKGGGGLVGLSWGGKIVDCYATGSVTGYGWLGGFVGSIQTYWEYRVKGVIENCFSTGDVSGDNRVGGFAGENGSSIIRNCYAMGSVSGREKIGGFVGCTYKYCRASEIDLTGDAIIDRCFSVGKVTGSIRTGGLVGSHWKGIQIISNSFWNIETSDFFDSAGGTGKTTNEMIAGPTFIDAGWDFVGEDVSGLDDFWWIDEGNDYPRLLWEVNRMPVANAGEDQIAYAGIDGFAQVKLNATGSYDEDEDKLEYFWYNDANDLIATGAEPDVVLTAGEHVIDLYVNDGLEASEPNSCVVSVRKK